MMQRMPGPVECPTCGTQLRGKFRYEYGLCAKCCKEDVRSQGRAELLVKSFLLKSGFENIIHNKTDPRTRSNVTSARADFRLVRDDCGYDVVIEVDEKQHISRSPAREMERLLHLIFAADNRPLLVFRLNPDAYMIPTGKKSAGVTGLEFVKTLRERVEFLLERINIRERNIQRRKRANKNYQMPVLYIEYLFFDQDSTNPKYEKMSVRHYQTVKDVEKRIQTLTSSS